MRKTGYLLIGVLMLSLGAAPAWTHADWGRGGPGRHHGGFGGPGMHMMGGGPGMALHVILRKLHLTSDQQQAVDKIMADHREKFQKGFQDMRAARKALNDKFFSDNPSAADDPDLKTLRDALKASQDALMDEGFSTVQDIQKYLVSQGLWSQALQIWQQMQAMREQMHNFFDEKP